MNVAQRAPKKQPSARALKQSRLFIYATNVHQGGGRPQLLLPGTPVYFHVEGLPDRGVYYLIAQVPSLPVDDPLTSDEKRVYLSYVPAVVVQRG